MESAMPLKKKTPESEMGKQPKKKTALVNVQKLYYRRGHALREGGELSGRQSGKK